MRNSEVGQGRWRGGRIRAALGVALAVMALAGPARADTEEVYDENPWPGDLTEVSPDEDAFAEDRAPNKGVGFLASIGSVVMNAVVFPVKLVVGTAGAVTGGVSGAMNGGDEEAAAGVWNVTTDGSYFITPQVLEGREPFRLSGDHR